MSDISSTVEKIYILVSRMGGGGPPRRMGENFKVTASSFKKYLGNAVILCDYYTAHILGEAGKGMIVFFRFLYCK